jgi:hypothetical protein
MSLLALIAMAFTTYNIELKMAIRENKEKARKEIFQK